MNCFIKLFKHYLEMLSNLLEQDEDNEIISIDEFINYGERKINVAELLKNYPKGMELDCATYENVVFDYVDDTNDTFPIKCHIKLPDNKCSICSFTSYGCNDLHNYAKCVIFPKGKTTWEGFVPPCKFKDGDIIFTHANCLKVGVGNTWISIFKEKRNGGVATYVDYAEDGSDYYSDLDGDKALLCMERDILRQRLATEEEKAKLFGAIKAKGYRWDEETKTLEKLIEPKFKVGDMIVERNSITNSFIVNSVSSEYYGLKLPKGSESIGVLAVSEQDNWELVPGKFDINTLKPFDKVLVRLTNNCVWMPKFFSHYDTDPKVKYYPFVTTDNIGYPQCIPYEKNEYLSNTTDYCDKYYKTWK